MGSLIFTVDMSKVSEGGSRNDPISPQVSFHDLSIDNSPSIDFGSCRVTGSDITSVGSSKISEEGFVDKRVDNDVKNADVNLGGEECLHSGSSSVSYCNGVEAREPSLRSACPLKPHKGIDPRWDAVQCVQGRDGELGLGHFRLLRKLGYGDIGSVYLAELRGSGCLFAMKVMDKGMLVSRKKVLRAQTERDILGLLDHPFLPTLYSHFETGKFSCLLMEFCTGGDLHLLRQRQPGKHFSEQSARLAFDVHIFVHFK